VAQFPSTAEYCHHHPGKPSSPVSLSPSCWPPWPISGVVTHVHYTECHPDSPR